MPKTTTQALPINAQQSVPQLMPAPPVPCDIQSLVDDYLLIDLPLVPELEQYMYVLYTECDVYFHSKVCVTVVSSVQQSV